LNILLNLLKQSYHLAKQQKVISKPISTVGKSTENSGFGYLLRNGILIIGFGLLFLLFDKLNEKQSKLPELYQEFNQLQQSRSNPARLQEVYNEIVTLQADTSFLTKITRGYRWAIHDLAFKNLENIEQVKQQLSIQRADSTPQALFEAKMNMKVGLYPMFNYIKANTPEDAVILLPEGDAAVSNNSRWNFIYDPEWVEYFIYPRLCLAIGREEEHPELKNKITHVLIIEGKGYDRLNYDVPLDQRPSEAILPINQPPAGLQAN